VACPPGARVVPTRSLSPALKAWNNSDQTFYSRKKDPKRGLGKPSTHLTVGSQSVRSREEAVTTVEQRDAGRGKRTERTRDKEPTPVPARADLRRRPPGAIDRVGTGDLNALLGDEVKRRSLSIEHPLTGREICLSGLEGGVAHRAIPPPYQKPAESPRRFPIPATAFIKPL
jgi:hypothetical protein